MTVCLAGHFLLPVAVRGGVGGGFIASRAGAPAAPCTCRSTGLSSPSPAQLILWAHARRKSCRLRTDWVSVLKTGRVPSGLDSSGGGGKQAACRSHVLTCSGPRVPGAVLRFVPGRRQPGTCWLYQRPPAQPSAAIEPGCPPEGSLEKQAAGLSPSPGWGGEWSRTGQLGVTMASCAALRVRQGSGTQLGTLSRLPRVGGLGNPGHAPPRCPGGRRVRVAGARGDESGGQSEAAGRTSCRAEQGRRCPLWGGGREGGGARVSLGTQARPGPTSSVLRGCSLLTFAGGFCTLACEGRWSKSGPRPRGHEPSD